MMHKTLSDKKHTPGRFKNTPDRIAALPRDERGFPIPWFAAEIDGKPDIRVADTHKMARAIKERRCWVCGERLGVHMAFVIGPMCGINRVISDPPSHRACAEFSVMNCPFLSRPLAKRTSDEIRDKGIVHDAAGFGLKRNPGAVGIWVTKSYRVFRPNAGNAGILFSLGDPEKVTWYASGRAATREEVEHSIATGLPSLQELAGQQDREEPGAGAMAALDALIKRFMDKVLPMTFEAASASSEPVRAVRG